MNIRPKQLIHFLAVMSDEFDMWNQLELAAQTVDVYLCGSSLRRTPKLVERVTRLLLRPTAELRSAWEARSMARSAEDEDKRAEYYELHAKDARACAAKLRGKAMAVLSGGLRCT